MQEEVQNRTVTLTISGARLTGRTLKWAIRQLLNSHSKNKAKRVQAKAITPKGKQSVKELVGQNQGMKSSSAKHRNEHLMSFCYLTLLQKQRTATRRNFRHSRSCGQSMQRCFSRKRRHTRNTTRSRMSTAS